MGDLFKIKQFQRNLWQNVENNNLGELSIFKEIRKIQKECVEAENYCIDFFIASYPNAGFIYFFP